MTSVVLRLPMPPSVNARNVPNEVIIEAYKRLGNVWRVGEELGMRGQTVAVRLKKAGHPRKNPQITEEERTRIRKYYNDTPQADFSLTKLSKQLGRSRPLICRTARAMGLTTLRRPAAEEELKKARRRKWIAPAEPWTWKNKPHPRGMLGKKHTPETLQKVSEASRRNWATWKAFGTGPASPEAKAKGRIRMAVQAARISASQTHSRAKGGHRQDLDGLYLRSSWEANYARYLNLLLKMGIIESWEYEPETFWFEGVRRGAVSYKPDFRVKYKHDPNPEYVELKGWIVAKDRTKWKRMAKYHPQIKLVILGAKEYASLKNKWASSIPTWEHAAKEPKFRRIMGREI